MERIRRLAFYIDPVEITLNGDFCRGCRERMSPFAVDHEQLWLLAVSDKALEIALRHIVMLSGSHIVIIVISSRRGQWDAKLP